MSEITIKTTSVCIQEHSKINKVLATINAKNLAKLLDIEDPLTANPRKSKKNKITKAICETLQHSPKNMRFMSKGLLVSTSSCKQRERGRFTLTFDDPNFEGVLDGGHNMLAIGIFILEEYFGEENDKELRTIKDWDTFKTVWDKHSQEIDKVLDALDFELPIEIIYPSGENEEVEFADGIFEISDARNNNSSLTAGAKADHKGHYEILKDVIDKNIKDEIAWKDGEKGRINRDDIVAMSLIPLLALQDAGVVKKGVPQINPVNIYSGKGKCIETFSVFFEKYRDEGKVTDELFLSAINLMNDLPKLYDVIYKKFPEAYNDNSSRFGGMSCVKKYDNKKAKTKYYQNDCDYKYPDGLIMPIFVSLYRLMEVSNNEVKWKVKEPQAFISQNLSSIAKTMVDIIRVNNYNPNSVGKEKSSYRFLKDAMDLLCNG